MGGAESLVIPFVRGIDRERYDLFVCCLASIGGNVNEAAVRAENVPFTNLGARNLLDVRAFRRLLRFIRDHDIDLIHAHLTYAATWAALASRMTGVPSLATLHVAPPQRGRAHLRDQLMRFALKRWSSGVIAVSAALREQYRALGEGSWRLTADSWRARELRQPLAASRQPLPPSTRTNVIVAHNGIDVSRFAGDRAASRARIAEQFAIPPDATIIATVSVLREGKGVEVLLRAFEKIGDAYLLIIGDGPKRDEWRSLAKNDRIRWAGFRNDVHALLPGCDIFVLASFDDAFPTVLLEAMAAGLPVVASRVGGIPEIVEEGVTGLLVPAGDENALADAIDQLLQGDRTAMAAAARQRARERFSTEAWIARLEEIYARVLSP
jgi:glycosyltransferase involved in cell wall biosynthesis